MLSNAIFLDVLDDDFACLEQRRRLLEKIAPAEREGMHPVSLGTTSAWAAETGARAETTAPQLDLLEFPAAELYAMPAATQTLLDDAYADVDEWLADEVEASFSAQESAAFVTGDGSNKPKGFLSYDMIADASHAWDKIGFILSGGAGAFAASNPADKLIDLVYALKSQFRANARFVMNRQGPCFGDPAQVGSG